jgi:hypothetical protein
MLPYTISIFVSLLGDDWIVQGKPFGRAQRYLLHLLVRIRQKHGECTSYFSSLISSLKYIFFLVFFCLSVGCVIRVTVGVVIGVADLILPDKNIGEVGRKFTKHFH